MIVIVGFSNLYRMSQCVNILNCLTSINQHTKDSIPCSWPDYGVLQLVDWTGRAERANKRGVIAQDTPPILERLNIQPKHWLSHAMAFEQHHAKVFNREQTTQAIRSG